MARAHSRAKLSRGSMPSPKPGLRRIAVLAGAHCARGDYSYPVLRCGVAGSRRLWQGGTVDRSSLVGLAVAVAVLTVATGLGLWWRRRDGRLRGVAGDAGPHNQVDVRSTVVGSTVGDENKAL